MPSLRTDSGLPEQEAVRLISPDLPNRAARGREKRQPMKSSTNIHYKRARKQGFALIITLLMMILLTILAVGLLSLSTISLRSSQSDFARSEAKANARLALQLAIAELQKYAGADQRVTARADILEPAGNSGALKQPWLTGVWKTEDNPLSSELGRDLRLKRPQKLPAYLISGNERFDLSSAASGSGSYPAGYLTPDQPLPAGTSGLPGDVKVGSCSRAGIEKEVRAPRLSVRGKNAAKGGYAYWVEDEGVKARVDLPNLFDASTQARQKLANNVLGQRNRADWIAKGGNASDPGQSLSALPTNGDDPLFNKLVSHQSLEMIGGNPQTVRADLGKLRSDITTYSSSLLIDQQRGGFRRDLTTALKASNLQTMVSNGVFDSELIFEQQGKSSPGETGVDLFYRPGGSPWSVLKDYADYAKRVTSMAQALPLNVSTNSLSGRSFNADSQFCPVVNRVQVGLNVSYQKAGGANYDIMFHVFPMIELWNPYDQPMTLPPFTVKIFANNNNSAGWRELSFDYELQGAHTVVSPAPPAALPAVTFAPSLSFKSSKTFTLPPGKSIILTSPDKHTEWKSTGDGQELQARWQDGFGLYMKGATISFPNPNAAPQIKVQLHKLISNDFGNEVQLWSDELGFQLLGISWDLDRTIDFFTPQVRAATQPLTSPNPRWGGVASRKTIDNQLQGLAGPNTANGYPAKAIAAYNLRAHHYSNVGNAVSTPPELICGTVVAGSNGAPEMTPAIVNPIDPAPHYAFVGGSDQAGGADTCVMFHIPRNGEPILSLAQFSHATLVRPFDPNNHRRRSIGEDLEPTYPIGNSVRPPHHPADKLRIASARTGDFGQTAAERDNPDYRYRADTSFLYNNALWDTYFLSGYDDSSQSFLNGRLRWNTEDPSARAAFPNDPKNNLAMVSMEGGFNVNSTSKAAWKALLASTVGVRTNANGKPSAQPGYNRINDTDSRFQTIGSGMTASSPDPYLGQARMLDDSEIDRLAGQIVEQVKLRGPFPTLAAFVNRSVDPASHGRSVTQAEVCNSGALQAALDGPKDSDDINKDISRSNWVMQKDLPSNAQPYNSSKSGYIHRDAAEGGRGYGAPLYLMPSDILAKIGPFLTARSDTFTIRAYGESRDAQGKLLAQVRCEAVVQRRPEWVGNLLKATDTPAAGSVEERFGRQFQIVRFRWLNHNDPT